MKDKLERKKAPIKKAIRNAGKDRKFLTDIEEIGKDFECADFEKMKSILSLGGIAKGRRVGVGREREYTKKIISNRIVKDRKFID